MLQINLLPEEARETSLSSLEQLHRIPLIWIVVGLLIGFGLVLLIPVHFNQRRLNVLTKQIEQLKPKEFEVHKLQQTLNQLKREAAAFEQIKSGNRRAWSQRLNKLSDLTPDGIWFTNLDLDPVKGLVIQGAAIGQGGSEMANVGKLVQDIKGDTEFTSAFKDVQIESLKRVYEKEIEVVRFTLICQLSTTPET